MVQFFFKKPALSEAPLLGFSNSMWQSSGDKRDANGEVTTKSNWSEAAGKNGVPQFGNAYNHYDNYEADLDIMQRDGCTSYRFSIEWKDIEPEEGVINEIALAHYGKIIAACKKRGIEPMVTLMHFVEPYWFTQKGGFEKEENIQKYFVPHCERIFKAFQKDVKLWCTINEPSLQAFSGYLYGQFPPHRHSVQSTIDVLANLLKAHVEVYAALKQLEGGEEARIGIVHNVLKFVPGMSWEPLENFLTGFLTRITNDLVLNFFKTGVFYYHNLAAFKFFSDPRAKTSNDFIGLNYYANAMIGFNWKNIFGPTCRPDQVMGDMYLPIDAQGFAAAIDSCAELNVPVIISETGIADNTDRVRAMFLKEFLEVFEQKRAAGLDLRAFYFWTFKKNIEWNEGDTKDFGMYNPDGTDKASTNIYRLFMQKYLLVPEKVEPAPARLTG
jgi:beta-glucosidase